MKYSKKQILEFVNSSKFKNYQKITLPYGIVIDGADLHNTADVLLPKDLKGKSVADIGCNYGYFCHEAKKRGAKEVIGIEINKETARTARKIADIIGDGVKIEDNINNLGNKTYDIILLLNVTHHLEDPVKFIRDISKKCRSLVVEFPTPCDESFIIRDKGVKISFAKLNIIGKILYKAKLFLRRRVFGYIDNHYGIIGVGSIGYDNCFYFNKKAFDYTFLVHNKIFKKICYKTSPRFPKRLIAFCSV